MHACMHFPTTGLLVVQMVSSKANLADLPSRDEFELLEQLGGRRVPVSFPPAADWRGPLRHWYTRVANNRPPPAPLQPYPLQRPRASA